MKKLIFTTFLFVSVLLSGCKDNDCDDKTWDFNTYDIRFMVTNAASENLMDPEVEGNLLNSDIYIKYNGEIYRINADKTRANPPIWEGLRTGQDYYKTEPIMLMFGEFGPTTNYKGETFTIHWGDGTSNVVKFDLYITWNDCEPTVRRNLWFNGELIPNNSFTIQIVK